MYKLTESPNLVIRVADNAYITLPPCNIDGAEYMDWLADGNTPLPYATEAEIFSTAQEAKRQEIRTAYATMECDNYTDSNLVVWTGGEVSATRLYGAYNLAKETGQLDVVFYDDAGSPHTLLLADALLVCIGVATNSRVCFDRKQSLMLQIDAALTQADLDLIIW